MPKMLCFKRIIHQRSVRRPALMKRCRLQLAACSPVCFWHRHVGIINAAFGIEAMSGAGIFLRLLHRRVFSGGGIGIIKRRASNMCALGGLVASKKWRRNLQRKPLSVTQSIFIACFEHLEAIRLLAERRKSPAAGIAVPNCSTDGKLPVIVIFLPSALPSVRRHSRRRRLFSTPVMKSHASLLHRRLIIAKHEMRLQNRRQSIPVIISRRIGVDIHKTHGSECRHFAGEAVINREQKGPAGDLFELSLRHVSACCHFSLSRGSVPRLYMSPENRPSSLSRSAWRFDLSSCSSSAAI